MDLTGAGVTQGTVPAPGVGSAATPPHAQPDFRHGVAEVL